MPQESMLHLVRGKSWSLGLCGGILKGTFVPLFKASTAWRGLLGPLSDIFAGTKLHGPRKTDWKGRGIVYQQRHCYWSGLLTAPALIHALPTPITALFLSHAVFHPLPPALWPTYLCSSAGQGHAVANAHCLQHWDGCAEWRITICNNDKLCFTTRTYFL